MKTILFTLVCALALVGCQSDPNAPKCMDGKWSKETYNGHSYVVRSVVCYGAEGTTVTHDPDCPAEKKK